MKIRSMLTSVTALAMVFMVAATVYAADQTVVITGDTSAGENQPGWLFNRDVSTSTPYEFNTDAASIGSGSLYVLPIGANAADKFIGENFINTAMADVSSIAYDFKIGGGGDANDANHFYMNVYANFGESDPLKFYDCRYNVVPAAGSTANFTTVTFDTAQAYPVTTRNTSPHPCPAVPADMDLLSPGSNLRVFALNVGDTAANDVGLDGYLDNVVVDTADGVTTYDFEPALTPTTKRECLRDGWMIFNTPSFNSAEQCVRFVERNNKGERDRNHEYQQEHGHDNDQPVR